MNEDSGRSRWMGLAALGAAVIILGSLAVSGPLGERSIVVAPAAELVSKVVWGHVIRLMPLWLIAAMLLMERRRRGLAVACIVLACVDLVLACVDLSGNREMLVGAFPTWFVLDVYYPTILGLPALGVTAVLVLLPRLRGKWWILQYGMVAGMCVFAELFLRAPREVNTPEDGIWVMSGGLVGAALCVGGLMTAWLMMFRQLRMNRRPSDCKGEVKLACPRCGKEQTVGLGEGECRGCRLQVFISVDEGACRRCGYRLRGLSGERCPECGTAIVEEAEAAA